MTPDMLRQEISKLVEQYANVALASKPFGAGETIIPPSGKVIGARELQLMVEASLDGWLTTGRFNAEFEKKLQNSSVSNSCCRSTPALPPTWLLSAR